MSNEHMDKGKYFEWLLLGGGAISSQEVTDLPRLKNGDKSVEQLRIEAQAERGKKLFIPGEPEYLGLKLVQTQLEIKTKTGRKGTIDAVAQDEDGNIWVLDIKLTADLTSTRSEYSWGNAWSDLDLLQQVHYESLYEEAFGIRPKMGLLVFDYSTSKRVEFGEINISQSKRLDKEVRFQAAEEAFELYNKNGWIKIPSVKECELCPLKCQSRLLGSKLVKRKIDY